MNDFKRGKKSSSKKTLFNPYKNGISSYDLAYLSSKRFFKNKNIHLKSVHIKDYLAS